MMIKFPKNSPEKETPWFCFEKDIPEIVDFLRGERIKLTRTVNPRAYESNKYFNFYLMYQKYKDWLDAKQKKK